MLPHSLISITQVNVSYDKVFHEPKASEMSRNVSRKTSVISDVSYTRERKIGREREGERVITLSTVSNT